MNGFSPTNQPPTPLPAAAATASPGGWIASTAVFMSIFFSTFLLATVVAVYCCLLCRDRVRSDDDTAGAERARGGGIIAPFPVEALPVAFAYAAGSSDDGIHVGGATATAAASGGRECAVCLGAVRDGEMVRRLPACGHVYHAGCIDRWLAAHRTCPLCRRELDPGKNPPDQLPNRLVGKGPAIFSYACAGLTGVAVVAVVVFYCNRHFRRRAPVVSAAGGREDEVRGVADVAAKIPEFAYTGSARQGGGREGAQCSVCLGAVQAGEVVRRLPACKHLYHVECIDMWLASHATCPLCRTEVEPPADEPSPTEALPPV
uniref:RING-type E3 ubiquitin transferase n=1 Tax=Oryza punctata TaxID=4537 RepID=A0A0E0LCB2_ORYPU